MKPKSNLQPRRRGTKASDKKPMELLVDKDLEWVQKITQQTAEPTPTPSKAKSPVPKGKAGAKSPAVATTKASGKKGLPAQEDTVQTISPTPQTTPLSPQNPSAAATEIKRKRGRPRKDQTAAPAEAITALATANAPTWEIEEANQSREAEVAIEAAANPPTNTTYLNRATIKQAVASGEIYDLHRFLAEHIYNLQVPLPKRPYPIASGVYYQPEQAEWALSSWEMENNTPEGLFKEAYLKRRPVVERAGRPMLRAFADSEVKAVQLLDLHPILFAYLGNESVIQSGEGVYIDNLQLQEIMKQQGHTFYSLQWLSGGLLDYDLMTNLVMGYSMIGGLSKDKREILNAILNLPNVFEEEMRIEADEKALSKAAARPQADREVAVEEDPEIAWLRGKDYKERLELSLSALADLQTYVQQVLDGLNRPPLEELVSAMQQVIKLGAMTAKQGEEAIAKLKVEAQKTSQSLSISQEGLKAKAHKAHKLLVVLQDDPSNPS